MERWRSWQKKMTRESGQAVKAVHGDGIATGQVSVGASATQILPARQGRRSALVVPLGSTDVFIGDNSITPSTGCKLPSAGLVVTTEAALYGVVASGSLTVSFMELF